MSNKFKKILWGLIALLIIISLLITTWAAISRVETQLEEQINDTAPVMGEPEVMATNLDIPWDIAFLPDGRMIVTERTGRVLLFENDNRSDLGVIENVAAEGEGGLMGVAVDPDFSQNSYLYLYYTYRRGNELRNGIARWTLDGNRITDEHHIIDTIPAALNHNGGRIRFGPDGKLYVATGDASNPNFAQDRNSLIGKILRLNKDGSTPEDNPFGNEVWAYGFRNPQGLAWHPVTQALYVTEHGQQRMDEINIVEKGSNYGWPNYECDQRRDGEISEHNPPIVCFNEFTLAPSGLTFVGDRDLYVAGLRGNQLRHLALSSNLRSVESQRQLFEQYGRLRAVVLHRGYLYFSTNNTDGRGQPGEGDDKIIRVMVAR